MVAQTTRKNLRFTGRPEGIRRWREEEEIEARRFWPLGRRPADSPAAVLDRIGNTPLLRLHRLGREGAPEVEIYLKAEWFNPGGSVKDRAALGMILDGEQSGQLTRDKIILDSTSGNTGIAYAMIGAIKGYRVTLVIPSNVSDERKKIVRSYGAEIVFSDPLEGSDGARLVADRMKEESPERYFMPGQYDNPANWKAHYYSTGVEIWRQTGGQVTHLVAGIGTSGTLMGTGRRLKKYNPDVQVIAVEPDSDLHGLEGLKYMPTARAPKIYDPRVHDRKINVDTERAHEVVHRLATEEGLLVGHSAGASVYAALQVAAQIEKGVIVAVCPDGGDRYLSTWHG